MSRPSRAAKLISTLYDDPQQCARLAKLRYVSPEDPGMTRLRKGTGFTYRDHDGVTVVDVEVRDRIKHIAIPPAWRNVWICTFPDGHILATGNDERGRRQYVYHERWRSIRDQLNFYRLIGFGDALPAIRLDVDAQLRRRTFDTHRVVAAMLRIIDLAGLRIGNEEYAAENDSYGLTTLGPQHVKITGSEIAFFFPAKSHKTADVTIIDAGVARVVSRLQEQGGKRLFTVDGEVIHSGMVNARLHELTGAHLSAKDFRTWKGTSTAFAHLRAHLPAGPHADREVLAAIDAASEALGNTRSVARAHYVHPDVVEAYTSGEMADFLKGRRARGSRELDTDEKLLLAFLSHALEARAGELAAA